MQCCRLRRLRITDAKDLERHPDKRSRRVKHSEVLEPEVLRVWEDNLSVYAAHTIWKQLNLESIPVGRWSVEVAMNSLSLEGIKRGRNCKTRLPSDQADAPLGLVNREFIGSGPNQLWVVDITYVATWSGFVFVGLSLVISSVGE